MTPEEQKRVDAVTDRLYPVPMPSPKMLALLGLSPAEYKRRYRLADQIPRFSLLANCEICDITRRATKSAGPAGRRKKCLNT